MEKLEHEVEIVDVVKLKMNRSINRSTYCKFKM